MLPTWPAGIQMGPPSWQHQEASAAAPTFESEYVEHLLRQNAIAKHVYSSIVAHSFGSLGQVPSIETATAAMMGYAEVQRQQALAASHQQLPAGSFAHAFQPTPGALPVNQESVTRFLEEPTSSLQESFASASCLHLRDLKPEGSQMPAQTFEVSNIPANWGFSGVMHNLHQLGIEKGFHYDCLCIPPKAEPNGRCKAFIHFGLKQADSNVIARLIHGLSRDAAGIVLSPPLAVVHAQHQGTTFYMERYPCDSILFDESGTQLPAMSASSLQAMSVKARQQLSGDVDPDILLTRLLHPGTADGISSTAETSPAGESPVLASHQCATGSEHPVGGRAAAEQQPRLLGARAAATEDSGIDGRCKKQELRDEGRNQNTSVFITHLPRDTDYTELLRLLEKQLGIIGGKDIDFLYIPMDFRTSKNTGVAVMNFRSPSEANRIMVKGRLRLDPEEVDGKLQAGSPAIQFATFNWAEVQGSAANANHFVKKRGRIRNSKMRPLIWKLSQASEASPLTNEDAVVMLEAASQAPLTRPV